MLIHGLVIDYIACILQCGELLENI